MANVALSRVVWTKELILQVCTKPLQWLEVRLEPTEIELGPLRKFLTQDEKGLYRLIKFQGKDVLYQMLQALYERQTREEQTVECTVANNGVGFNAFDAKFLTDVAINSRQYSGLTDRQAAFVGAALKKYSRQLLSISEAIHHPIVNKVKEEEQCQSSLFQ